VIGRLENGMVVDEKSALRSEMRKQADLTQKKMLFTNGAHSFRAKVRYQMAILPKAIQGSLIPRRTQTGQDILKGALVRKR
jgi:hypothetical protein